MLLITGTMLRRVEGLFLNLWPLDPFILQPFITLRTLKYSIRKTILSFTHRQSSLHHTCTLKKYYVLFSFQNIKYFWIVDFDTPAFRLFVISECICKYSCLEKHELVFILIHQHSGSLSLPNAHVYIYISCYWDRHELVFTLLGFQSDSNPWSLISYACWVFYIYTNCQHSPHALYYVLHILASYRSKHYLDS